MTTPNLPPDPGRDFLRQIVGTWQGKIVVAIVALVFIGALIRGAFPADNSTPPAPAGMISSATPVIAQTSPVTAATPEKPMSSRTAAVERPTRITMQPQPVTGKWYQGGRLHSATAEQWVRASDRNRLATSADWAFTMLQVEGRKPTLDQLKIYATELKTCINETTEPVPLVPQQKASEIAAVCWVIMGL